MAIVRSCPKALLNLKEGRTAALNEAFSRSEMHVELEEHEHLVSSFVVAICCCEERVVVVAAPPRVQINLKRVIRTYKPRKSRLP